MPTGKNWVNFLYVNIAFGIYIAGVFYYSQVAQIKANWPLYRCNPIYMPLADNLEENFIYCVQSMQTNFMGYLLQPLTFITNTIGSLLNNFMEEIQFVLYLYVLEWLYVHTRTLGRFEHGVCVDVWIGLRGECYGW